MKSASARHLASHGTAPGVQDLRLEPYDDAHGVGTWRNLLVAVWRTETRAPAVERVSRVLGALAATHGDVALLQVVEAGATAPDGEARRGISAMLKEHASVLRCSAVVYEGDGFRAATLRAVVTGISLLSKPSYPHVVFGSTITAINWTARHFSHDGPIWAEQARNAVGELRSSIERPTGSQGPSAGSARPRRFGDLSR